MTKENATVVPDLVKRGGRVAIGNHWIVMPSGVRVSLVHMALSDCTAGFVCLYANAGWAGRLIKSNQPGARIDLSANTFNDTMSSWANERPYDAKRFYNAEFTGTARCMQANSTNSAVSSTDNDKASSLALYTDGTTTKAVAAPDVLQLMSTTSQRRGWVLSQRSAVSIPTTHRIRRQA